MKALILAAGFGTRLAPYTRDLPKALFPVAGVPVLARMIHSLKQAGCTAIAVNLHHLAHRIDAYLAQNDFGLPITLSREPEILGTGGAIRRLAGYWGDEPFIVVNADIVSDIDLAEAYRSHQRHNAPVTLVVHDRPPFNRVWVDDRDQIAGFDRFPDANDHVNHRKMAFTGIHIVDAGLLEWIPEDGFSDIISVYRRMLTAAIPIQAHVVRDRYWQDIGSPESYREAVVDAMAPGLFRSTFPGTPDTTIASRQLCGDGSNRRWFRLTAGGRRLILADHGITLTPPGSEVEAFVKIGTHLCRCGLPVPRIYAHDGFSGLVFVQDLGDRHLQQEVQQAPNAGHIERRYRRIIDTMIDLTTLAADGFDPHWTCQSRSYDVALILDKECRYFVEAFLNGYLEMAVDYATLAPEFEYLARRTLDHAVPGLIHRDFQSRNIMIAGDRHYLIDFQGARSGPVQYDLASLLIDPYVGLARDLRQRLLDYGVEQAADRLACDPTRFVRGYRCCAVTRNLQMLGAFGHLSRIGGKRAFERWIPAAAAMLAGHLQAADPDAFPRLRTIAVKIAGA